MGTLARLAERLVAAAAAGRLVVVASLLRAGADPHRKTGGMTVAGLVCSSGDLPLLRLLVERYDIDLLERFDEGGSRTRSGATARRSFGISRRGAFRSAPGASPGA